jgi:hypothetical protein
MELQSLKLIILPILAFIDMRSKNKLIRNIVFILFVAANICLAQQKPLQISGVYPAFAAFNSSPNRARPQAECGIGALVPWAGKLWYLSYTSHDLFEGNDKLHSIDERYQHKIYAESVGGTHACRMIHSESEQLIIGCYFIDKSGKIRVVPRKELSGRLTAVTRHLSDPINKVLYLTQEGAVFEVDVHTLKSKMLFKKPAVGWHAKGAYTSQGVFAMSNNGEDSAPTPYWSVNYSDPFGVAKIEIIADSLFLTPKPKGPHVWGSLTEWDGKSWKLISRNQYVEVTGPGGLTGANSKDEPIWATGWDKSSLLLTVRDTGKWQNYRFLKPTYSMEGRNGSNTEWPRIREILPSQYLMFMNGGFFDFPATFSHKNSAGLTPLNSMLRTVTDYSIWDNQLVLSSQETSWHGIQKYVPGQPNSNLIFTSMDKLKRKGPIVGWGGVWRDDYVSANDPSDPLSINHFQHRTLHLYQTGTPSATVKIEVDERGNNQWKTVESIKLNAGEYVTRNIPSQLKSEWIRLVSDKSMKATAYVHAYSNRIFDSKEFEIFKGLAKIEEKQIPQISIIRQGFPTRNLQFLIIDGQGHEKYYEVDSTLNFIPKNDDKTSISELKNTHGIVSEILVDEASVIVKSGGIVYRLPKGLEEFSNWNTIRTVREVVQERFLANIHGTFFEVPRVASWKNDQQISTPDYIRMKPVSSHSLAINDFCTWRGLVVLSGISLESQSDGHIFKAENQRDGLWFGELDDLWKLGKPIGKGGPWKNSEVLANRYSDPYLMTGYDKKVVEFTHDSKKTVKFRIELDFLASGDFYHYKTIEVPTGKTISYRFPEGFSAHWVRLVPDSDCKATAIFIYQ